MKNFIRAFQMLMLTVAVFTAVSSFAATTPQALSIGGELYDATGTLVSQANVNFRIQIYDASETCVLYSEEHLAQDLATDKGHFNLILGAGTSITNNVGATGVLDAKVFANSGSTAVASCGSSPLSLTGTQERQIHVLYDLGSGYTLMTPSVPVVATAYAMVAETLSGLAATDFIQVNGTSSLNQANEEYAFSLTNWPKLKALLDGNSPQYLSSAPTAAFDLNGQKITDLADPTLAQDAATKHYADQNVGGKAVDVSGVGPSLGGGSTLVWDQVANKWVAGANTATPTGTAGGDLAGTYPNPTIKNDAIKSVAIKSTGVAVNRLIITDASTGANLGFGACTVNGQVYAWTATGWACTNVSTLAPVTSVAGKTGVVTLNAGDLTGLGTAALFDWGTAASQIVRLDSSARLPAVDGSLLTNVNTAQLQGRGVASTAPTTGQVLQWNGTAWLPTTVAGGGGSLSIASGAGLLGGPITSSGTLSVDTGTTANQVVQLNSSAQLPAVDGSLLGAVNAVSLQTRAVASAAPSAGQLLGWNASASRWEPTTPAAGASVSIASGTGLLGGPITSAGTLSIDVGTSANQVVQLNCSAQLLAVDASLLTQINAVNLQTRPVASTAPSSGQVLGWNAVSSQWQPVAAGGGGTVTSLASGTGLLGGPVTSTGTLSVDVGTSANQVVQLNGSAQLPAFDASLLTQINAVNLQSRPVASTAPTSGQVLGWNSVTSQWLPTTAAAGTMTSIASGTGLLGGPITSTGTFAVDVGNAANKIVQENANAQIAQGAGSVAQPSYAFAAQPGTGLYFPGAGFMGFAVNGTTAATLKDGGFFGIGTDDPDVNLHVSSTGYAHQILENTTGGVGAQIEVNTFGTTGNSIIALGHSRGYRTASTGLKAGDEMGYLSFGSADGTGQSARIYSYTLNDWGGSSTPGELSFQTTAVGAVSPTERMHISARGLIGINNDTPAAALDVQASGTTSALIVPRESLTNRPPGINGMIRYNSTNAKFEAFENNGWVNMIASGGMTSVATGTGLLGGPITTTGTLSVDVGTAANKVLQLNGSAQVPAVDGSLLTAVNAAKLQSWPISATTPIAGQILGWNNTASRWEATTPAAGGVTSIALGTALLGGPITSTGTITLDLGTAANKVVQENGSAQIAQANGTVALPSYSFGSSPNTGLFSPGTTQLALATNGTAALSILTNGYVGVGTTSPTAKLHVSGGAIVGTSLGITGASVDFSQSNVVVSTTAASTINVCGLSDGGAYTLVLTGLTNGASITVNGFEAANCTGASTVDLGAGATTFTASGNTNILNFIYVKTTVDGKTLYGATNGGFNVQ